MPIDPITGLLTPGAGAAAGSDLAQYGFSGFGTGGLLGSALANPLFNFGAGLLANTGPSLTPQSPWQAVGRGLSYASEAQQKALENQLYRQKLFESAQELQSTAKIQQLFKDNPDLANDPSKLVPLIAATGNKEFLGALAAQYTDPLFAVKRQMTMDQSAAAAAALADTKSKLELSYTDTHQLASAADYLKDHNGDVLVSSPWFTSILDKVQKGFNVAGLDPSSVIDAIPALKGTDPAVVKRMLQAAQTIYAKAPLYQSITGDLSSAGLDVQAEAYGTLNRQAERSAAEIKKADPKYALPELPRYAWEATANPPTATAAAPSAPITPPAPVPAAGSAGYRPGVGIVNDAGSSVSTPLPPAAAAAPDVPPVAPPSQHPIIDAFRKSRDALSEYVYGKEAPPTPQPPPTSTARKVPTLQYDPQGRPAFRSRAEFDRAVRNGSLATSLPEGGYVVIGGTVYPVTRGTGGPAGG